jgi:protein SCO1/2
MWHRKTGANSGRKFDWSYCRESGKALPLVIVSAVALAAGVFLYTLIGNDSSSRLGPQAGSEESASLNQLQESLVTSLALPEDFRTIGAFELLDVNAQPITEKVFEGKWSVIFFGFTHCPDVCPITLHVMHNVVEALEEQGQQAPQVVFVSMDPMRDTSDVMKKYLGFFDEDFVGITGDVTTIRQMTDPLGIVASFTANDEDPENYTVDHTASMLLIDPERRVRAKITGPHEAEKIIADYLAITQAAS